MTDGEKLATRSLHETIRKGQTEFVAHYLEERTGIDVNACDGYGMTALMWAAGRGYSDIAELVLKAGADVNATNDLLSVQSIEQLETGKSDICVTLDLMGALHAKKHHGWTALMWAARNGHTETVRLLHSHGADVNVISPNGFTALAHAIGEKHEATAFALLKLGAKPDLTVDGRSPALTSAVARGFLGLVEVMLARGADINAVGNHGKDAPMNAVIYNYPEILTVLLKHGLDVNAVRPAPDRLPLLHMAANADALECAKILLAHGADIDAKDKLNDHTALRWAVEDMGSPRVARLLIERGADIQGVLAIAEKYQDEEGAVDVLRLLRQRHEN